MRVCFLAIYGVLSAALPLDAQSPPLTLPTEIWCGFAGGPPAGLLELATADLVAVGTVIEARDRSFRFRLEDVVTGKAAVGHTVEVRRVPPNGNLHFRRANRRKGDRAFLFLDKDQTGWRIKASGGECLIQGGKVSVNFHMVLRNVSEVDYRLLRAAVSDLRQSYRIRRASDGELRVEELKPDRLESPFARRRPPLPFARRSWLHNYLALQMNGIVVSTPNHPPIKFVGLRAIPSDVVNHRVVRLGSPP